jgi:hypothetical protein
LNPSRRYLLALTAATVASAAGAQDDLWKRATLLDAPGGPKQEWADKGVHIGLDVTDFLQALQNDGSGWANGGKVDLRVRLDGHKLGTWQGFFVTSHSNTTMAATSTRTRRG